jgi:hypothetical protein
VEKARGYYISLAGYKKVQEKNILFLKNILQKI